MKLLRRSRRYPSTDEIFISYRAEDSKPSALVLRDKLVESFGAQRVFLDRDTLHAGEWSVQLDEALDRSRVVLVVIGPSWLSIVDDQGRRRLDQDDDVHRSEIVRALSRGGVTVIPVRVEGAGQPSAQELPPNLRPLLQRQFRELSDNLERRQLDLQLLVADIERATGRKASPSLRGERAPVWSIAAAAWRGVATVLAIGAVTFVVTLALQVVAERVFGRHWIPSVTAFVTLALVISGRLVWKRYRNE